MVTGVAPARRAGPASAEQAPGCRRATTAATHTAESFAGVDLSARAARAYIRAVLTGRVHAIDEAEVMVSELVTNALRYTLSGLPGGEVVVSVAIGDACARVEVKDAGPINDHVPTLRGYHDETGRGLKIVEAFAAEWGWQRCGRRGEQNVVWFEMDRGE